MENETAAPAAIHETTAQGHQVLPAAEVLSFPPKPRPSTGEARDAMLLKAEQVAALLSVSRAMFWKLHSQGRIPLPIRLSERVVRWRKQELVDWLAAGCPPRDKLILRKVLDIYASTG